MERNWVERTPSYFLHVAVFCDRTHCEAESQSCSASVPTRGQEQLLRCRCVWLQILNSASQGLLILSCLKLLWGRKFAFIFCKCTYVALLTAMVENVFGPCHRGESAYGFPEGLERRTSVLRTVHLY